MKNFYQKYKYWLKWIFSLVLLCIVFNKVDIYALKDGFKIVVWWYYPLILIFKLFAQIISTYKWHLLMPKNNFKELLKLNFIAQFYSFALPSSLTGDISRVINVDKKNTTINDAIVSILIDKIIGFFAILSLCLIAIYYTSIASLKVFLLPSIILFIVLFLLCSLFYTKFYEVITQFIISINIIEKSIFHKYLLNFKQILLIIKENILHFKKLILNYILSVIFQLLIVIPFVILNNLMELNLNIFDYLIISSVIQILIILPLSIGGLGLRDLSIISIMNLANISNENALIFSLIGYPIILFFVFIGGILIIMKPNTKE